MLKTPFTDSYKNPNLTALGALSGSGIVAKTGASSFAVRTITGTSNQVTVSNGDGVSGNPTLSLPQSIATSSDVQFNSLKVGDGTAAAPSLFFTNDTDTGIYRSTTNQVGIAVGGLAGVIVSTVSSAVNYASITNAVTGSGVIYGAAGSDTDISVNITPKGAGVVRANTGLFVNAGAATYDTLTAVHAIKASTDVQYCGERTSTGTGKMYWGGSANGFTVYNSTPAMVMRVSTTGDVSLCANQGAESLKAVYVASAVNRVEITGATTTNAVSVLAAGSDMNIDLRLGGKGTGLPDFRGGATYTAGAVAATGYVSLKVAGTTYKFAVAT